jgi:hypothetical protein
MTVDVDSETMLNPVLDGDALERAEAAFLCCEMTLRGLHPEVLVLSAADIPPLGTDRAAGIDYERLRKTVKTSSARCC